MLIGPDLSRESAETLGFLNNANVTIINALISDLDMTAKKRAEILGYAFVQTLENYKIQRGKTLFFSSNAQYYISNTLFAKIKQGDVIASIGHIYDPRSSLGSIGLQVRQDKFVMTEYTAKVQTVSTLDTYAHVTDTLLNYCSVEL